MATEAELVSAFERFERSFHDVIEDETQVHIAQVEQERDRARATLAAYKVGITNLLLRVGMSQAMIDALLLEFEGNVVVLEKPW